MSFAVGAVAERCPCEVRREEARIENITKITRVVLVALALYVEFQWAAIAFTVGLAVGALMRAKKIEFEKGTLSPLCITGYLEFCTGSRFPAVVRTAFTAAFLIDCIARGSPLFIGIVTAGVGYSVGYSALDWLKERPIAAIAA